MTRMTPIKLTLALLLLVIISSIAVIMSEWTYPLNELFSSNLPLEKLAKQLQILPTMMVALLAGGLLSLSSLLLQQIIGNTLASDTTLAVGGGANMAMLMAVVFLPNLGLYGSFWVALMGALSSMAVVFALSARSRFNPVSMVLSGLVVNVLLHSLVSLCLIFYSESAMGVMMWSGGILTQTSWNHVWWLTLMSLVFGVCLIPLIKPLTLMNLDDNTASSLGVPVKTIRLISMVLVAVIVAMVVSRLGVVSFIGLAGATLANVTATRHVHTRLLLGFVLGGLLLWLTSNMTILLSAMVGFNIPTGAMMGILGAPIIIYLLLTQKNEQIVAETPINTPKRKTVNFSLFVGILVVLCIFALVITPHEAGFGFNANWALIKEFRLARTLTAMSIGAMLAIAGVLLQRLTNNPMASPEILGISGGASLGVIIAFVLIPLLGIQNPMVFLLLSGLAGVFLVLMVILWLSSRLPNHHILLVGVAISALSASIMTLVKLSGDPRLSAILSWLSGTTYHVTPLMSVIFCVLSMIAIMVALLFARPTELMSLGDTIAQGRGLAVKRTQLTLLTLIALLSAISTLAVGSLSFIGLIIPHLALSLGAITLKKQLILGAILGAILLIVADYLGRYLAFPYEIPAGTLCAIVGVGYFMYLMSRQT